MVLLSIDHLAGVWLSSSTFVLLSENTPWLDGLRVGMECPLPIIGPPSLRREVGRPQGNPHSHGTYRLDPP